MKKKIIILALCLLMISGCGKKIPKLSNGEEAVVTFKGGDKISVDELYEEMKSEYAQEMLINMVDKKILEDKYKDKIDEATESLNATMDNLEQVYGDSLADTIKQYTGYSVEQFKNLTYLSNLKEYAITDYAKAQITDKEIKKYYEDEIVSDIKVSHILITAKVTADMTDEEKAAAEKEAKEKIDSIINELKNTKKTEIADKFAELANEYSEDTARKDKGGSLGFINKDTLSSEYKELVDAAYKLKDGEYSTKVITTELGYHVIYRAETKEKAELEDVKDTILDALSTKYITENPVANVKAMQELRKEYGVEIVDTDIQTKYAESIQNELNYYQQQANQNQ